MSTADDATSDPAETQPDQTPPAETQPGKSPDTDGPAAEPDHPVPVGPMPAAAWRRVARLAALPAALAAAVGLAGVLGWLLWQQHLLAAAGAAGQQAAVDYAVVLTSIDSNNVDENFDAVLNGATGDFKDTYTKASVQLRQLLIDNKQAAHGSVVASAVQSETKDQVVVLLMVDQTSTNTARPDPRTDRSRMKITMDKVDGRWLASKVELP